MPGSNGNGTKTAARADVLMPHSVEAEIYTLAALLMDGDKVATVAAFLEPGDFFIVRHAWIFEAMRRLLQRGTPIDYVTVAEELSNQGRLDKLGGRAYLTGIMNRCPSALYIEAYAEVVRRAAMRRRMLGAASELAKLARVEDMDIHEVLERGETVWQGVRRRAERSKLRAAADFGAEVLESAEKARSEGVSGIRTGLADVDSLTGGLQPEDLIIVAGRPGMGKTSWQLTVARNMARRSHQEGRTARIAFFSLEMSGKQLTQRLASMEIGISTKAIRAGKLEDAEYAALVDAVGRIADWPLFICDQPALTPAQIRAECLQMQAAHGLDAVFVDYLQLMAAGVKTDNRTQEVGYISRQLKALARELQVPLVVAAQLNRGCEQRQDKRPVLADLRDSGEIEQDADLVFFMYRDEIYHENTEHPGVLECILAKHRNGPTGNVWTYFYKERTEVRNLSTTDVDFAEWDGGPLAATHAAATM